MNKTSKYLVAVAAFAGAEQATPLPSTDVTTTYHHARDDCVGIFYREAGPGNAPTIVLLMVSHRLRASLTR